MLTLCFHSVTESQSLYLTGKTKIARRYHVETTMLGKTGLKVSRLGAGLAQLGQQRPQYRSPSFLFRVSSESSGETGDCSGPSPVRSSQIGTRDSGTISALVFTI